MAGKLEFISTTHKINAVATLTPGISRFVGMALAKGMSDKFLRPPTLTAGARGFLAHEGFRAGVSKEKVQRFQTFLQVMLRKWQWNRYSLCLDIYVQIWCCEVWVNSVLRASVPWRSDLPRFHLCFSCSWPLGLLSVYCMAASRAQRVTTEGRSKFEDLESTKNVATIQASPKVAWGGQPSQNASKDARKKMRKLQDAGEQDSSKKTSALKVKAINTRAAPATWWGWRPATERLHKCCQLLTTDRH